MGLALHLLFKTQILGYLSSLSSCTLSFIDILQFHFILFNQFLGFRFLRLLRLRLLLDCILDYGARYSWFIDDRLRTRRFLIVCLETNFLVLLHLLLPMCYDGVRAHSFLMLATYYHFLFWGAIIATKEFKPLSIFTLVSHITSGAIL